MANDTKPKDRPHLNDLFRVGETVQVNIPDPDDLDNPKTYEMFIRRPTVGQAEEARSAARAKQARRKKDFRDPESDLYLGVMDEIDAIETREDMLEALLAFNEQNLRTQAYNDVLFGKSGSDWGPDGGRLTDLIDAIQQRWAEIERHNDALEEGDQDMAIKPLEDPELAKLRSEQEMFEAEAAERLVQLQVDAAAEFKGTKMPDLKKLLFKKSVDLEGEMAWFQEYRVRMLWYAVREAEDSKVRYFQNKEDILELPIGVQQQLYNHYDRIDRGPAAKNSVSPLP